MTVAQSWFHGLLLNRVSSWNLSLESFVLGLITSAAAAWLVGYLFAYVSNRLSKK